MAIALAAGSVAGVSAGQHSGVCEAVSPGQQPWYGDGAIWPGQHPPPTPQLLGEGFVSILWEATAPAARMTSPKITVFQVFERPVSFGELQPQGLVSGDFCSSLMVHTSCQGRCIRVFKATQPGGRRIISAYSANTTVQLGFLFNLCGPGRIPRNILWEGMGLVEWGVTRGYGWRFVGVRYAQRAGDGLS